MPWLLFAFAGPVCWAVSTHIDKYLVERYFKEGSVVGLMVLTSIIGALSLPFIWWHAPRVLTVSPRDAAIVAFTGLLYMIAMWFYLGAMQSGEASEVAPLFQTMPLFGFVLAFIILNELPSLRQDLGAALIIVGSLVISLQPHRNGKCRFNRRMVGLMLAASAIIALNWAVFKYFAIQNDFWTTTFWELAGEAVFGIGIIFVAKYRRQIQDMFRANPGAVLGVNASNELINLGGGVCSSYALLFAPVAVIQAISSTTTLFVFAFGVILTLFFPELGREDLSLSNLTRKGLAAVLITAGVYFASIF